MSNVDSRVLYEAKLMLEGKRTVRGVAKMIGYSKSTVHNDVTSRLQQVDYGLYLEIKELLEYNKKIRHIRGGEATKEKYRLKLQ